MVKSIYIISLNYITDFIRSQVPGEKRGPVSYTHLDVYKRQGREKAACEKDLAALSGKLMNPGFVEKAPANVVEAERQRLQKVRERLAKIEESLSAFS